MLVRTCASASKRHSILQSARDQRINILRAAGIRVRVGPIKPVSRSSADGERESSLAQIEIKRSLTVNQIITRAICSLLQ